jgi:hypothetical protein
MLIKALLAATAFFAFCACSQESARTKSSANLEVKTSSNTESRGALHCEDPVQEALRKAFFSALDQYFSMIKEPIPEAAALKTAFEEYFEALNTRCEPAPETIPETAPDNALKFTSWVRVGFTKNISIAIQILDFKSTAAMKCFSVTGAKDGKSQLWEFLQEKSSGKWVVKKITGQLL